MVVIVKLIKLLIVFIVTFTLFSTSVNKRDSLLLNYNMVQGGT